MSDRKRRRVASFTLLRNRCCFRRRGTNIIKKNAQVNEAKNSIFFYFWRNKWFSYRCHVAKIADRDPLLVGSLVCDVALVGFLEEETFPYLCWCNNRRRQTAFGYVYFFRIILSLSPTSSPAGYPSLYLWKVLSCTHFFLLTWVWPTGWRCTWPALISHS